MRSSADVGRLSAAVSRPGIDPRVWLTIARVVECGFDEEQGIFVDVQFQPGGEIETAYLGTTYAGNGFGLHCPLNVDDTVLVAIPDGDPGNGPIVIARWHNGGDPPNAELQDEEDEEDCTKDVVLRVQPGKKLKIRTSDEGDGVDITVDGDGDVVIQATGDGKVFLGGTDGTEPIPLGSTLKRHLDQIKADFDAHIHTTTATVGTGPVGTISPPTSPLTSTPDIEADEAEVK